MSDSLPPNPTAAPASSRISASELALIIGGLALFVLLVYTMREKVLNPILIALAAGILLWPMKDRRGVRAIMLSGGFLLILWFFAELSTVLLPFALAYVLAYLFNPLVDFLKDRISMPRWASALVVTTLVVGSVVLFMLLLVPSIVGEIGTLANRVVTGANDLQAWLVNSSLVNMLEANGIIEKDRFIEQFMGLVQNQAGAVSDGVPGVAQQVINSVGSFLGTIAMFGIVPVLLFYTLKDYPDISSKIVGIFPTFGGERNYLAKAGGVVGDYLRGQLTISAIAAFLVGILLLIFDVPFALLIGVMAGLLNLIPSFGIIITYIIGALLALIFGDPPLIKAAIVIGVIMFESFLESTVLTPNIMGQKLGMHPVLILLSLFIFGYFMGIFGLIIAVPATALMVAAYQESQSEMTLELAAYTTTPTVMWGARGPGNTPPPPPPNMPSGPPQQTRTYTPPSGPPSQIRTTPPPPPKPPKK